MVLLPYSGPYCVADKRYFDTDAQFLASRGYAVLQVNNRGSGSRGRALEATGYSQWSGRLHLDRIDAVR